MAAIIIQKKSFLDHLKKALADSEITAIIQKLGVSVEQITHTELTLEVLPNRPDLLSEAGLVRALQAFLGIKKGLRKYAVRKSGGKVFIDPSVKDVRPYTACALVKKLNFGNEKIKEIMQLQEKLHATFGRNRNKVAIGMYPLDKIKLPITYTAKAPQEIRFRPLEANREMSATEILEEHPAGKAYAYLLQEAKKYPVFIDANKNILSLPPIINSHETGRVTEKTTEVFIECSGHQSGAVKTCLNLIVTTLAEMGGEIYSMELNDGKKKETTPDLTPVKRKLNIKYLNQRIGASFKEKEIKFLLEKMGHDYNAGNVFISAYRTDMLHEIDLAEDIAIAYGYENLKPELPNAATVGEESPFEVFRNKLCNLLVGFRLLELNTYHLTSEEVVNEKMNHNGEIIELANVANQEFNVLRSWMLPGVMQILGENTRYEYPQRVFCSGIVFKKDEQEETRIKEQTKLAVALAGKGEDFTKIKQILAGMMDALAVIWSIKETEHPSFIEGRVGAVLVDGNEIGFVGEIHPRVLDNFKIEMPMAALELNLSELFKTLK
ncbi:phenylalanine--tRNA ligase subunit beta [Candidatus Woesearchaeota archaeon]|nr:phenylalanine--tRNA ligase subunit beta [Candidatus Woesearchaeota archaeon]